MNFRDDTMKNMIKQLASLKYIPLNYRLKFWLFQFFEEDLFYISK